MGLAGATEQDQVLRMMRQDEELERLEARRKEL